MKVVAAMAMIGCSVIVAAPAGADTGCEVSAFCIPVEKTGPNIVERTIQTYAELPGKTFETYRNLPQTVVKNWSNAIHDGIRNWTGVSVGDDPDPES